MKGYQPIDKPVVKTTNMWQYGKGIIEQTEIKVATWNVNGIRSVHKRRFLEPYITQNKIDIMCVNETKIDE